MDAISFPQPELRVTRTLPTKISVMREYLESDDPALRFEFSSGRNHHDFGAQRQNVLVPTENSKISITPKASVYSYRRNAELPKPLTFKRDVIVKQIHGNNIKRNNTNAVKEVRVQEFLYHPHITAFLGTFTVYERLNIVMYPVACGNLGEFMEEVCQIWRAEKSGPMPVSVLDPTNHLTGETGELPIRRGHTRNNSRNLKEVQSRADDTTRGSSASPFPWPLAEKLHRLCGWFACLSAALQYLHETGVRHKDIKPANIVIDSSGSALLTDFGISRLFPPGTEHVTNDQWFHTPEYASPEMMKGPDEKRSDPSDVFSLGCVFVEMATVLLQSDLDDFIYFRSDSGAQEDHVHYHKSLPRVSEWISHGCAPPGKSKIKSPTNSAVFKVLPAIRGMLAEIPEERPGTKELWGIFKDVSVDKCPDCDFRLEDTRWKPSADQIRKTQEAFNQRTTLLGAETLRVPQSPDSRRLPIGGLAPASGAQYPANHEVVDDDDGNPSDTSSRVVPIVMVRAPTAPTDLQVPSLDPRNPSPQRTGHQHVYESATSSGLLNTATPISYDSGGSSSTTSKNRHTLVYYVREETLRIEKFSSIDQSRRHEMCQLPPGRIVVIYSQSGDLIATLDLGKIENKKYYKFRIRRRLRQFSHVCVLFE